MQRLRIIAAISLALLAIGAADARATTLQPIGNFAQPTYVTSDPGDAERLFVVEREGTIDLVDHGVTSQFADLSSEVECKGACQGERGLMSIALAPDFDASGRLYVDYVNDEDGTIHVDELLAEGPDHESAAGATPRSLLAIPHPTESNHNGGQLQFGPDRDLYISTGDGGGGNDKFHNSQDLKKPLGKILRIRPNPTGPEFFYTVPADNPFAAVAGDYAPIWSYGLRNPFRFSFDSLSGDMVIGDVGQGKSEEVDFAPSPLPGVVGGAGTDYGWNCREGSFPGPLTDPQCAEPPAAGFADPVFDYLHAPDPDLGGPSRCAIIGGYVVRDAALGALYGHYVYADLCSGAIRAQQLPAGAGGRSSDDCSLGLQVNHPVSFGEDSAHRLYVVEQGGRVDRLAGLPPPTCPAPPPAALPSPSLRARPSRTLIGITAQRRRVERGKIALLTVWVSPCKDRKGELVELLRNGHRDGTKFLSRVCTARFLSRIHRRTSFAAAIREDDSYLPAASRRLTIRLAHRRHHG